MHINSKDLDEFRRQWESELGEPVSPDQAQLRTTELLELFAVLARPLPSESVETHEKNRSPNV